MLGEKKEKIKKILNALARKLMSRFRMSMNGSKTKVVVVRRWESNQRNIQIRVKR